MIAIDNNAGALATLATRLTECGLSEKFTLMADDVLDLDPHGDVVLFEFFLHEMPQPERDIAHARGLAPGVLGIDQASGSSWSYYAAEEAGVEAAWRAGERAAIRREGAFEASQRFADYGELEAKLANQGPSSAERIRRFRDQKAISIAMPYRLALL